MVLTTPMVMVPSPHLRASRGPRWRRAWPRGGCGVGPTKRFSALPRPKSSSGWSSPQPLKAAWGVRCWFWRSGRLLEAHLVALAGGQQLPCASPSLPPLVTQCFTHSHPKHSHHLLLFLNLLIAPSFALCAQLEAEICWVGVGIGGAG